MSITSSNIIKNTFEEFLVDFKITVFKYFGNNPLNFFFWNTSSLYSSFLGPTDHLNIIFDNWEPVIIKLKNEYFAFSELLEIANNNSEEFQNEVDILLYNFQNKTSSKLISIM